MQPIFISSTGSDAGQTLFAWALADLLIGAKKTVGIFKPIGLKSQDGAENPDVELLASRLNIDLPHEILCPLMIDATQGIDPDVAQSYLSRIEKAYAQASEGRDITLILGSRDIFFDTDFSSLPDVKFIDLLNAKVFLIDRFISKSRTFYSVMAIASFLSSKLAGILINRVPDLERSPLEEQISKARSIGVPLFATISEDIVLSKPTIDAIVKALNGTYLCLPEMGKRLVLRSTLSSEALPNQMSIFKRVHNKVVLLGDEVDVVARGEGENTPEAILITSGRIPPDAALSSAKASGIPLIAVSADTIHSMEIINSYPFHLTLDDEFKKDRFAKALLEQVDKTRLLAACGV